MTSLEDDFRKHNAWAVVGKVLIAVAVPMSMAFFWLGSLSTTQAGIRDLATSNQTAIARQQDIVQRLTVLIERQDERLKFLER